MTLEEAMEEVSEACRDMGCEEEWQFIKYYIRGLNEKYNEVLAYIDGEHS